MQAEFFVMFDIAAKLLSLANVVFSGFFDEKMWSFETSKINFFVSLRYRLRVVEVDLEKNWINWVVVLHNWMEVKCGH